MSLPSGGVRVLDFVGGGSAWRVPARPKRLGITHAGSARVVAPTFEIRDEGIDQGVVLAASEEHLWDVTPGAHDSVGVGQVIGRRVLALARLLEFRPGDSVLLTRLGAQMRYRPPAADQDVPLLSVPLVARAGALLVGADSGSVPRAVRAAPLGKVTDHLREEVEQLGTAEVRRVLAGADFPDAGRFQKGIRESSAGIRVEPGFGIFGHVSLADGSAVAVGVGWRGGFWTVSVAGRSQASDADLTRATLRSFDASALVEEGAEEAWWVGRAARFELAPAFAGVAELYSALGERFLLWSDEEFAALSVDLGAVSASGT